MDGDIIKLLELIRKVVAVDGSWKEKRDRVLEHAGDDDRTALHEFAGWFEADAETT